MFFVGTAPLHAEGHINISPKGYDVLRIVSPTEVAYLDLTGSGNETSAHLEENKRITFMFIALEGPPMILRLYGKGRVILPETEEWKHWAPQFELLPGTRQIICAELHAVKTSCGFSVPYYSYSGDRDTLKQWAANKSEQDLAGYRQEKNRVSMDGLVTSIGQRAEEQK
ncbi:MAG: pyridoxamine 5-phosphate oxidase family protein [Paenibacillus sp.]|nr:pyridoxamine 5-phosphate oxidase family protein [Paenibacillus sp.]